MAAGELGQRAPSLSGHLAPNTQYAWMDFFMSKDGQEWLQTHKPVENGK